MMKRRTNNYDLPTAECCKVNSMKRTIFPVFLLGYLNAYAIDSEMGGKEDSLSVGAKYRWGSIFSNTEFNASISLVYIYIYI